jgi:hypothetical protein
LSPTKDYVYSKLNHKNFIDINKNNLTNNKNSTILNNNDHIPNNKLTKKLKQNVNKFTTNREVNINVKPVKAVYTTPNASPICERIMTIYKNMEKHS